MKLSLVRRVAVSVLLASALAACDDARRPGGSTPPPTRKDASADAGEPGQDAREGEDAMVAADVPGGGGFDAPPGGFDAPPGGFDAPPGNLDARPAPDAPSFPDAFVFPDVPTFPDAGPPDAGPAVSGSIADIRSGIIPFGATVTLTDVVVTAFHDEVARNDTIWVQDPRAGTRNGGIKVFIRGSHTAFRDARVDVTGVVTDYFGETEINNATVVNRGTVTTVSPMPLTVAEAMDESREGMLVTLTDVFSVTAPYSCSVDDALCTDARLWEVNGAIVVFDYAYEGFEWEVRTGVTNITGVMMWRYNRRRIVPRTDADLPF